MQIEHKKNTDYYLAFPMVSSTSPEAFASGLTVSDTAYYKDGSGSWTSLPISDTATEIGSTGIYEIDLSASELNHDQVIIKMTSSGSADTAFLLDMRAKLASDLNDITVTDILTTQMTESYATDGTEPTMAQALFGLTSFQNERSVAGTTMTCKQLDGSTTSMTFTLNDATSPTSITRSS